MPLTEPLGRALRAILHASREIERAKRLAEEARIRCANSRLVRTEVSVGIALSKRMRLLRSGR